MAVVQTSEWEIQVLLFGVGLVLLAVSTGLSRLALASARSWPKTAARTLGVLAALAGWWLFWGPPTHHGNLGSPVLLLLAAAYPLLAVEPGRALAGRVFIWTALILLVSGCACSFVLPLNPRNIAIQEGLLVAGVIAPPCLMILVMLIVAVRGSRLAGRSNR